jgi:hypothetical protein
MDGNLRQIFRKKLPQFHWQSIETGGTGRGIPDSNYCCSGEEGWVEFKKTSGWKVNIRPEQVGWLLRRSRAGGRTWLAVRRKGDQLWLVRGSQAEELLDRGLRDFLAPSWEGGPARWDWEAINRLLTGPK